jgi:murein endopeptidase
VVEARTRATILLAAATLVLAAAAAAHGDDASFGGEGTEVRVRSIPAEDPNGVEVTRPPIAWHPSRAFGRPDHGRLLDGVQLPAEGADYVTWDPVLDRRPNRAWRRWGTDRLLRVFLRTAAAYRRAHPRAPRLVVGDLSRPHGGHFGPEFGGVGHASHQNGLDIDIFYPRRDRRLSEPVRVGQIDRPLAQDLVDRFVAAGAQYVFVGPHTGLRGPRPIVQPLYLHDNHMHVRIHNPLGDG